MDLVPKMLEFRKLSQRLEMDPEALLEMRERRLRSLIHHAWMHVPYYRSLFDSVGLNPASIRTLDDLTKIPITTKDDLRAAGQQRTVARGIDPAACSRFRTSGSTGKPFEVLLSRSEERTQLLLRLRAQSSAGLFRPRERFVLLGPARWRQHRLYQKLGFFRRDYVSPSLSVDDQIERLRRLQPGVLWIYPSLLAALLERLDGRLSEVIQPRAIVTNSEVTPQSIRDAIRADMNAELFNFYGAIEVGRIAWECRSHRGLHLSADAIILETIDGGQGEAGRVIVTALDARTMPFIRYDLGDLCAYSGPTCPCGIAFPLLDAPQGRRTGFIRLPDGGMVGASVLNTILRERLEIDQFQIRQETIDLVEVHVVPRGRFPEQDRAGLARLLRQRLGDSIHVEILVGDSLPPGPKRSYFYSGL